MRKRRLPSVGTIIALVALIVSLGGVAYATIPGANGTIIGCYSPAGGKPPYQLSVVDNAADCASPAVVLPFSQNGATGATGRTGAMGPAGPTGAAGPAGSAGAPGSSASEASDWFSPYFADSPTGDVQLHMEVLNRHVKTTHVQVYF